MKKSLLWLVTIILAISSCHFFEDAREFPPIAYLGWDEDGKNQIFRYRPDDTNQPEQITDADDGVLDFAVADDGQTVVYSTPVVNNASALWLTNMNSSRNQLLLSCPGAECGLPVWAADSRRLIYERRELRDDKTARRAYLWWLDTRTGETKPLIEDDEVRGNAARFSPDEQWLSYVSPEVDRTVIYNLKDGQTQFLANEIGAPAAWNPASDKVVVPNLDLVIIHGDEGDDHLGHAHDYRSATHLFTFDVTNGEMKNVSGDLNVEDSVPAWSPDGQRIAFGRRFPGTSAGRQIWLMNADGSDQRALTNNADVHHGPPFWSPDGKYLLFQRYVAHEYDAEPGIWMLELESGDTRELVIEGMQPSWLVKTLH